MRCQVSRVRDIQSHHWSPTAFGRLPELPDLLGRAVSPSSIHAHPSSCSPDTYTHTHTYIHTQLIHSHTLTHTPHILTYTHSHTYTTFTQHTHIYHTHTYTHIDHTHTHAHIRTPPTFICSHIYTLTAPVAKSLPKWFSSCLWLSPWVPTMVNEMESIVPENKSVPVATLTL